MASQILSVPARTYGMRIYTIMLPPSDFSVAHWTIHAECAAFSILYDANAVV